MIQLCSRQTLNFAPQFFCQAGSSLYSFVGSLMVRIEILRQKMDSVPKSIIRFFHTRVKICQEQTLSRMDKSLKSSSLKVSLKGLASLIPKSSISYTNIPGSVMRSHLELLLGLSKGWRGEGSFTK